MNREEGFGVCCRTAPSRDKLEEMFKKAGALRLGPLLRLAS